MNDGSISKEITGGDGDLINAEQHSRQTPSTMPDLTDWICVCETMNKGSYKFCSECGNPKHITKTCECGTQNQGRFCSECGAPNPAMAPSPKPGVDDGKPAYASNSFRYGFLLDKSEETKTAMSVVNKVLRPNQKAYARFAFDNMAFLEIFTSLPPDVKDMSIPSEYVVVTLDSEPRLIRLPNKELFVRFARAVRADPKLMSPSRRIETALILTTGSSDCIQSMGGDEFSPTWTDDGDVLVISYYKYVGQGGMARPRKARCALSVDANQDFVLDCQDVGY